MCGISGLFSQQGHACLNEVVDMNNKIAHRGPDNNSFFHNDYIAFGHRRLSIIDLNERSNQPMEYEGLIIVFNGEVYNYKTIRTNLADAGYHFTTDGDCEVVLKAYHMWGGDCVHHFKGMWAFVIYDSNETAIFCSRDRFGIKPFYYKIDKGRFYFGSEMKQLTGETCFPVMDNVIDYIVGGYVDHNQFTFFEGVMQLPPSCNLTISTDLFEADVSRYFSLSDEIEPQDLDGIKSLLDKAIKQHLIADVKVGSCLSGGLDSSYINYGLSVAQPDSIAIHCNSSDHKYSEKDKAENVAQSLGITLKVIEPTITDFNADIDKLFYIQEQPFGDPSVYMQYCVMEKAQALGIKVMLDGQGADEVFMGYSKYLGSRLWSDFSLFSVRKFYRCFTESLQNNDLSGIHLLSFMFGTKFEKFKRLGLLIKSAIPLKHWFEFIGRGEGSRSSRAFQLSEIYEYPLQTLLRNEDRNSMWFSIEARVPYLDHHLVQALYQKPTRNKVSNGWSKNLLRIIAVGCLPRAIVYRKDKLGFNSPPSWLDEISYSEIYESNILKKIFGNDLTAAWIATLDSKLKWRLLSVAIWERIFKITVRET
jgi:asparagine synthase (glutamine-hydrolysing)